MRLAFAFLAAIAFAAALAPAPAWAQSAAGTQAQDQAADPSGDEPLSEEETAVAAARGHDLARLLCTRCHDIEGPGPSPNDKAPPFSTLIKRLTVEGIADQILEGLPLGHDPMPRWEFSEEQAAELILYIESIKPQN